MLRAFTVALLALVSSQAQAAGDLSRQEPIELVVELGRPGAPHAFAPNKIEFETGKLYKLVLKKHERPAALLHVARVFAVTRKVQVVAKVGDKNQTFAEFKGAIREVEVYPGHSAEWWLVPVASGRLTDLKCGIRGADGKTHSEHGMVGEIVIR